LAGPPRSSDRKRAAAAFALSFAAYLTPLVGPHAAFLLGEVILDDTGHAIHGGADRTLGWIATDVGVGLLAQLALFLMIFWFWRRPGWLRGLCLGASVIPAIFLLNLAYMEAIPIHFLLEPDTAAERTNWPVQCTARNVWIPQIASPPTISGFTPIVTADVNPPNRYGLLDPSNCSVRTLALEQSAARYVTYTVAGRALYLTAPPPDARRSWSVFDFASGASVQLGTVGTDAGQFPILSTDGKSIGWLRPVAGATPPIQLEAVIQKIGAAGERIVSLSALERGGMVQLVELDTRTEEIAVARGLNELFWIGFDGRIRRTLRPAAVDPQPQTIRLVDRGWVAWDAYRENQPYRVAWSLARGAGSLRVPKGRSITSLAVSPDGRWIALSVTSALSIGSTADAVSVVRVTDGAEVFRKYLPKYTRSSVAFGDAGQFIYTDLDGVEVLAIR